MPSQVESSKLSRLKRRIPPAIKEGAMAQASNKNVRDHDLEFQGLLSDLQSWERVVKESDKNPKGQVDKIGKPTGKGTERKGQSMKSATVDQKDILGCSDFTNYSYFSNSRSLSSEDTPNATSEKELGNDYFKQKKYAHAIECYSRSIALSPSAVAYANRAMAYLKTRRYEEAENDCTEALNLDDRYVKAYSRRATARKELGKLHASIEDAEFALRLEPNNQELKKQYAEIKEIFAKIAMKKISGAGKSSTQDSGNKRDSVSEIKIDVQDAQPQRSQMDSNGKISKKDPSVMKEVQSRRTPEDLNVRLGSQETHGSTPAKSQLDVSKDNHKEFMKHQSKESILEVASRAASRAKAAAAQNIATPKSAYEFEVAWRRLSEDRASQCLLLKTILPESLPQLFKNALSAPMLIEIIKCVAEFFREETNLAVNILDNLTRIGRFDMIIMCLSSKDKADLQRIWDEVVSSCAVTMEHAETLERLHSKYCPR
ncbi:RNA polymerase II-associated protein 3 isoform X2 [Amborella trichopoda]|uniref:RNA polymerase II-associated protein 3 isoform X2 n=1 Tax=Amborella trichopoda TaxID=13333 RepID=UPI0009C06F36|nr:RNA polymerase II-associated protein 3 isoform X2 [Amborella trichopoda]|eukprot:XP_020520546.1 RNA polymerase II-associated protein 3 isoform X2 [Amborella trichopoda]